MTVRGTDRATGLVGTHVVEVCLTEGDVAEPGLVPIEMRQPGEVNAPTAVAQLRVCPRVERVVTSPKKPLRLQVEGAGFADDASVTVEGSSRPFEIADARRLVVTVQEDDQTEAAFRAMMVVNPVDQRGQAAPFPRDAGAGWNA